LAANSGSIRTLPASPVRKAYQSVGQPKPETAAAGKPKTVAARSGDLQNWAIQVGAYHRYAPAHLAVTRAARAVPDLLGTDFAIVRQSSNVKQGLNIYKARLLVASESKARTSCDALKQRK